MAARPLLQKLSRRIEELGGEEFIFDQIAAGVSVREISKSLRGFLSERPEYPSRTQIYRWIHAGGAEREQEWEKAKEISSHSLVEDGFELLEDDDKAPVTSADASRMRQRVEYRKWLAGVRNREEYGEEKQGVDVNFNVGSLHLDALRSAGRMDAVEGGDDPDVIEAESEIVEDDTARPTIPADSEPGE